ncbi:long-chain fatty acid--CoA ligase [Streptomyces europaeiscabiei]|uniref:acyl-CoA synthetase n=1 Tax=Streptomyces europaeiscabiei TaxID=146819 RepID=UPI0029BE12F4|nr:long-chain fatty acid--CoA ligase [Streptomyces europaeiscabiei]MDX3629921.1 long-chain fatty acid--CoA ligase [Streptomyces europaeiscabiei]MDX3652174.1 long-chain fatty acid--CoA ligase [Streptomyces europaeiscabiei]
MIPPSATTPHPRNSGLHVDLNPAAAVACNARFQGGSIAIRYPGGDLTYAQLDDKAARLATVLADGGIGDGDRVAHLGLNSSSFLVTLLAAHRLGAVFVPVNFRLAEAELEAVLVRSGATALVCEEGHRESVDNVRDRTALALLLLVDDDCEVPTAGASGWEPWAPRIAVAAPTASIAAKGADDPAILMFTSGTTGTPKGVVLTHGNLWWNSVNVELRLDTRRGDVTYAAAPLFHIGALNSFVLRTLVRGGTVVIRRGFDPQTCLEDLVTHRVNSVFGVAQMFAALARQPGLFDEDLSHLRSIVVAGAPVPPSLIELYAKHGVLLQQAWGLTETAPFATHLPVERTLDKIGSAGIPMPFTEVRVVDAATNTPLRPGEPGEIVVRGPNVTAGYWNTPEANHAAFDEEGWFHSGDIGYLDEDGYLYIVDRLKDMIISGGENVYPAEVERVLASMPGVVDVAVVGIPDEQWGETVQAVMSVDDTAAITLEAVHEYAAGQLARYKLPRRLKIVPAVPRNASGKLDKAGVRRLAHEGN